MCLQYGVTTRREANINWVSQIDTTAANVITAVGRVRYSLVEESPYELVQAFLLQHYMYECRNRSSAIDHERLT